MGMTVKEALTTVQNATWSLELWNPKTKRPLSLADGSKREWLFRWPPSSFHLDQTLRADVGLDLLGNPTAQYLGSGLGQITLSGSHGVKKVDGPYLKWEGIAHQTSLENFFSQWHNLLKSANTAGAPYPLMVLCVRGGTQSEWQNAEYIVWPLKRPTTERDASKPLEWRYAMQFWVMKRLESTARIQDFSAEGMAALAQALSETTESGLAAMVRKAGNIASFAKMALKTVKKLKELAMNVRSQALGAIQGVRQSLQELNSDIEAIQKALDTKSFNRDARQELGRICRELKTLHGLATRLVLVSDASRQVTAVAPLESAPLQALASSALGDSSRWRDIASANKLGYPYAPSGPLVLPDGAIQTPGASEASAGIKIGSDLDPSGRIGVLVSGVENLTEALLRRLRCPLGYLPHEPEYGSMLYSYLGAPYDLPTALSVRAEVERTLLADDRVTRVASLSVLGNDSLDAFFVNAQVECIYGTADVSGSITRGAA